MRCSDSYGVMLLLGLAVLCTCSMTCSSDPPRSKGQRQDPPVSKARLKAEDFAKKAAVVLQAAEIRDVVALAGVLKDGHPVVATLALTKLRLLTLPEDLAQAYVGAARKKDARALAESTEAILKWARERDGKETVKSPRIIGNEQALMEAVSVWRQRIRYGGAPDAEAEEYATVLLGASQMCKDAGRKARLANAILALLDREEVKKSVDIGKAFVVSEKDSEKILGGLSGWLAENLPYLYFHPKERRLKLDAKAAESKTPSSEYRAKHPWGKEEGPHKTDPKKTPVK